MKYAGTVLSIFFFCWKLSAQQPISLAGQWNVKYGQASDALVHLPGTLDDAGIGAPPTLTDAKLTREVLLHLTRKHTYIGTASYERDIDIPQSWKGKSITLELERVLWTSRVRVDGREAGAGESLTTPHYYELGNLLTPGRHHIVIEVDNRKQYDISIRDMAHSYTEETQIIWNGILGKIQLTARNPEHIGAVQVYPMEKKIRVVTQLEGKGRLLLQVLDKAGHLVASSQKDVTASSEDEIALPDGKAWDEFTPNLYTVRATLTTSHSKDVVNTTCGMRTLSNENSELWINGHRMFLRGTLECDIFPLTGHPPMDRRGWLKEFTVAKSYGLNHLRFHSWCPPAAAFEVADSMGFYLQIELPLWNKNAGKDTAMNRFLREEAFRISREYGNHPSFCFWSMGNELEGDFDWLHGMVSTLRQADARHLYTSTTFSFQAGHGKWPEPGDDFYITQYTKKGWVRGQGIFNTYAPDFKSDYTKAVDGLPVPLIIHEMGQYSVYPDMREINKYTGVLDPLNFKAIRRDLDRKGMLDLSSAFTKASGKFAARLYKEEIERVLKTPGTSGFQLLDLHDFPGQGTALIGILDAFWDSKGLVTPEQHRMYCSAVVPLIRFDKAIYTNNEQFTATAELANFGSGVLKGVIPEWAVTDAAGRRVAGGVLARQDIGMGNGQSLGSFSFSLGEVKQAAQLTITLRLKGTSYKNEWNIWVYPEHIAEPTIVFDSTLEGALHHLQQGKDVLFNPDTACLNGVTGRFAPVFWSPVHFPDQPGTMGLSMRPDHPALKDFPTESYSDWQWWDLVTSSKTMILDSLPVIDPIVRVIDNFVKNRKMAEVIEARVGKGRLVIVSADIRRDLDHRPAARQLRYSLEKYMQGAAFHPGVELDAGQLERLAGCGSNSLKGQVSMRLKEAAGQVRLLMRRTARDSFPETFDPRTGRYGMGKTSSWMSGFYPGELLYLFEATHDASLLAEARRKLDVLQKEQYNKDTHDLGFMMYCSFGNAERLTPDSSYRRVILNSARSLATRWNEKVGCTRSWNSDPGRFMVIIDNMMNLELLTEATRMTGDTSFYKIAVTHANTTIKNHFRPDYSSYHLVIYDPKTGDVLKKQTVQGAADSSAWARGQAWGLYGYTMMYRETRDRKYLEQAEHIAGYIIPRLPADRIPYWDFDAPGIPNTERDVTAASIMCSALIELSGYADKDKGKTYLQTAEGMLRSLLSPAYSAIAGEGGGFLLKHGVGNHPKNSDIDVSIIYADYYFIEAMLRWQRLDPSAVRVQTDSILSRYKRYLLAGSRPPIDSTARVAASYDPARQWTDIDYGNQQRANWQLWTHLKRTRDIALEWSDPRSGHYHDSTWWLVINQALDHWLQHRYHNPNWWHNEIGVPQCMRDILVLTGDQLTAERKQGALEVMKQLRVQAPGAGANLAWSADLGLHYGALIGDEALVRRCADLLIGEIHITTGDGIQPDYSFHQHSARLQMYQYGAAFLEQNVRLAWQLKGTPWAFPEEKIRLLSDFVLQGWQWMCRGINTVPGTIDRSVSRIGALHSADMRSPAPYLCEIAPSEAKAFQAIAARQSGGGEPLQGFRYYPYSDFAVWQGGKFSFFLKTLSDRTLPAESINSENLKGRLMNSGDAYIIRNGMEYFNLMPVWDWNKLPGITSFPGAVRIVRHPFAGSVTDSISGLTVMDYEMKDSVGHSLRAKKYWACHDGVVVCLIAGVDLARGPGSPLAPDSAFTVLDQCRKQGDVVSGDGWVWHSGLAYMVLGRDKLQVHTGEVSGSWQSINQSLPATLVKDSVFMPIVYYRAGGPFSSGYIIAACDGPGQAAKMGKGQKILRNDTACQAVRFADGVTLCAFWQPGEVRLGHGQQLQVDQSCLVLVSGDRLYVSSATHVRKEVTISFEGKSRHFVLPEDGTTVRDQF
ncbi:MAG TPA: polysaccharide lyase family 8 super-sandwich domain-containing protein [Puia sp.]|nr:polysaccharide lyase family 8 super-sandwich domain-containing protein [Puia sp.]